MQEKYLPYAAYIDKIVQNQIQAKKIWKNFQKTLDFSVFIVYIYNCCDIDSVETRGCYM